MSNIAIACVVIFAAAVLGVVGVVLYNSLRGVRITREALIAYFGVLAALVVVVVLIVFVFPAG